MDPDEVSQSSSQQPMKSAPAGDTSSRKSRSSSPVKSILSRAQSIKSHLTGSLSRLNFSMKDEPIDPPNKVPASNGDNNDIVKDSGVEFVVPVKNHHISSEDEVDIQVNAGLTTANEATAPVTIQTVNTGPIANKRTIQQQSIVVGDKIISVRIEDGGNLSPVKLGHRRLVDSSTASSSVSRSVKRRRQTSVERENQERIDRENRILLRKILEQHHGMRRSSAIPPPPTRSHKQKYPLSSSSKLGGSTYDLDLHRRKPTSNQINQQKWKHKTDYENLLLLQKIQNAKPSRAIEKSFDRMKL